MECESLGGAYTAHGWVGWREWVELGGKEVDLDKEGEKEGKEEELLKIKKRKEHLVYQFIGNVTKLPVILHWYVSSSSSPFYLLNKTCTGLR